MGSHRVAPSRELWNFIISKSLGLVWWKVSTAASNHHSRKHHCQVMLRRNLYGTLLSEYDNIFGCTGTIRWDFSEVRWLCTQVGSTYYLVKCKKILKFNTDEDTDKLDRYWLNITNWFDCNFVYSKIFLAQYESHCTSQIIFPQCIFIRSFLLRSTKSQPNKITKEGSLGTFLRPQWEYQIVSSK